MSPDAEYPACPNCGTNVLVGRAMGTFDGYRCHGCDNRWRAEADAQ